MGSRCLRGAPVPDEPESLRQAIMEAVRDNDIVILNAGASAGTEDFTAQVLSEIGTVIVHGVAIKPGKAGYPGHGRRYAGDRIAGLSDLGHAYPASLRP